MEKWGRSYCVPSTLYYSIIKSLLKIDIYDYDYHHRLLKLISYHQPGECIILSPHQLHLFIALLHLNYILSFASYIDVRNCYYYQQPSSNCIVPWFSRQQSSSCWVSQLSNLLATHHYLSWVLMRIHLPPLLQHRPLSRYLQLKKTIALPHPQEFTSALCYLISAIYHQSSYCIIVSLHHC